MSIALKNISGSVLAVHAHEFAVDEVLEIQDEYRKSWANNDDTLAAIANDALQVQLNGVAISGVSDQINELKATVAPIVSVDSTPPFAEPAHRTKLDAVASAVAIQPGEAGNIDYLMTEERWAYGGEGFVVGAEPGDWLEAMVVDANSVIPVPYRAALCEASPGWPVINTYVKKSWMLCPGGGQNAVFKINTYPLIAKVTAGLVLRTIYHATSAGGARTVYANLLLTKKL
jgi:hypothetical protein